MSLEIREIRDEDLMRAGEILDAAYGPGTDRPARLRRYRMLGEHLWLLALDDDVPVGLAGAIDYGSYSYVGLVGVLPAVHRRGIALRLMNELLARLDAEGSRTVLLDATIAGAPLYRKLGFVDDGEARLFYGASIEPVTQSRAARPMKEADLAAVAALDERIGGADRRRLLESYFSDAAGAHVALDGNGDLRGFAFARSSVIGPWIAEDDSSAEAALRAVLTSPFGPRVLVATPAENSSVGPILERHGFAYERSLTHMRLGPRASRDRARIYGQASLAAG